MALLSATVSFAVRRAVRKAAMALAGLVVSAAGLVGACASTGEPPSLRPTPIELVDTLPIYEPQPRTPHQIKEMFKTSVGGEIDRAFSTRKWFGSVQEAQNLTPFDDVVDSAWFEHRNGRRPMTPEEIARGPTSKGPAEEGPLAVIAGKREGISPGFTVRDGAGVVFFVKFDPKGFQRLSSAAGVISNRLFYAAGYHTPEDYLFVFDPERLVLDDSATVVFPGGERPMTREDVYGILELTDSLPDGQYLAIASKAIDGTNLGPFLFNGTRADDPNDHYDHEYRRELRGLYAVSAWLNHVDMRYENTADFFVPDPGYVKHYLIDFAATLGSGTIRSHTPREGTEYNFDFWSSMGRLVTLGLLQAGWENQEWSVIHPSIGWLAVEGYDPASWKANWPNQAWSRRTVRDDYWGAKLVASFSDAQIRAAVDQGALPDVAADTLDKILAYRRDRTARHWFSEVTPIEDVVLEFGERGAHTLVFSDLGLDHGYWSPEETTYGWRFEHRVRNLERTGSEPANDEGRQRLELLFPPRRAVDAETLNEVQRVARLTITSERSGAESRRAVVYLRWEPQPDNPNRYLVVGLEH